MPGLNHLFVMSNARALVTTPAGRRQSHRALLTKHLGPTGAAQGSMVIVAGEQTSLRESMMETVGLATR